MKKLKWLIVLLLGLLLFSSCASMSETELKNRLIIEGIGIDFDDETKDYLLTVQVLISNHSGGKESAPEKPVENYEVRGKTIAQALNELCNVTGKKSLHSQNRVVVLGSSLDGKQIVKALDYFAREYTARADIYITAATGRAADIMNVSESGSEITAKVIENAITESYRNSISVNTELFNVVNLSLEENTWFTMPLLEVVDDAKKGGKSVRVTGTYVYSDDEKNHLSSEETMFFGIIMDDTRNGTFSAEAKDVRVGLDIIKSETKIKTDMKNGRPFYDIKVCSDIDIIEYDTEEFGDLKKDDIADVKKTAVSHIQNGIESLLDRELKDRKCDIFRFGRRFMQKFPKEYEKISDTWQDILPQIGYKVTVEVNIRRIGQETLKKS